MMERASSGRQMKPGLDGESMDAGDTARANADEFDPSKIDDEEMEEGSSRQVKKGREYEGSQEVGIEGSFMGSGDGGEPAIRGSSMASTTDGKEAKISGSHMGHRK